MVSDIDQISNSSGFSSHELTSHWRDEDRSRRFKSSIFYIILVIVISMVIVFSWYVINKNLSKNPYRKNQIMTQDSWAKSLPTLGDILRWSWWKDDSHTWLDDINLITWDIIASWKVISWIILTYTWWSTWTIDTISWYDRVYLEHIRDFLYLLDRDPNLKWYFDTDNMLLSGQDMIVTDLASSLPSTTLKLYGTVYPHIKNLYIIWTNSSGVYYFNTIKHDNGIRSMELDGIKWSLKPWQNTYYLVWTDGVKYYINYIDYKTYNQEEFYQKLGRICILDVYTDPSIQLVHNTNDWSYLQQNGDTVIKVTPGQEIVVATRCVWSGSSLVSIKKIWDIYKKTTKWCNYITNGNVKQEFINYLWETVISHDLMHKYPTSINWWNLSYIADFEINGDITNLQKIDYLDYYDISAISISKWYLVTKLSFELPGDVFINYKLSNTPIMSLGYTQILSWSDFWSAYKIAPRSFDRTNRGIVYTIPWSDPNMASILNQKLFLNNPGRVVISPNCGQSTSPTDPNARFGVYPIDDKYEMIWFLNCNIIVRN